MSAHLRQLWLLHFAGNALLLTLVYLWLGIGDQRVIQLIGAAVSGLLIMFGILWLHGATFAYFAQHANASLPAVFRKVLRRLFPFAIWAVLSMAALWLLNNHLLRLAAIALLIPLAGSVASRGFRGFIGRGAPLRYWLAFPLLVAICGYLPYRLVTWVPSVSGFTLQAVSLALRFFVAYALIVTGWLLLAYFSSGGKPRDTQPSTVPLP